MRLLRVIAVKAKAPRVASFLPRELVQDERNALLSGALDPLSPELEGVLGLPSHLVDLLCHYAHVPGCDKSEGWLS